MAKTSKEHTNKVRPSKDRIEKIASHKTKERRPNELISREAIVLDNMSELVVYQDTNHNILWANKAVSELAGKRADELRGEKCHQIWSQRNKPCPGCPVKKSIQTGMPQNGQIITPDGRIWAVKADPVNNTQGKVVGAVELTTEITEQKRLERMMRGFAETPIGFMRLPMDRDIYGYICEQVKQIAGNAIVAVNSIDVDRSILKVRRILGIQGRMLSKTEKLLGSSVLNLSLEGVSKEAKAALTSCKLTKVEGGLYTLLFGNVPRSVCRQLEELLDIKETHSIGLIRSGKLFGSITILTRDGAYLNREYIEAFVNQASNALKRRQAEQAVKDSEEQLRILFENAPDAIYLKDLEGVFVNGNHAVEKITGYKREELIGKSFIEKELLDDRDLPRAINNLKKVAAGRGTGPDDFTLKRKNGSTAKVEIRTYPVRIKGKLLSLDIARDITKRKKAEVELRESQVKLKVVVESISDQMSVIDNKFNIIWVNEATKHVFGDNIVGKKCYKVYHSRSEPCGQRQCVAVRTLKDGRTHEHETEVIDMHGRKRYHHCIANVAFRDDKGKPLTVLEVSRDITDQKKVKKKLRFLSAVVEQSTEGMAIAELDGKLTYVNDTWCKMHGFNSSKELLGKNLAIFHTKEQMENEVKPFNEKAKELGTYSGEIGHITKDGKHLPTLMVTTVLRNEQGKPIALAGIAKDITGLKRAEKELLEKQARLKALASQLTLTEERERYRLAGVLHDKIGQALVLSKLKLDALYHLVSDKSVKDELDDVRNSLGRTIRNTKSLTHDLSFPVLYEFGFESAVATWLDEQIGEKYDIITEFKDDKQPKPMAQDISVLLFRSVRELLYNVIRHAQAEKVKVSVCRVDENIRVCVEDDGVGFNPDTEVTGKGVEVGGFGLFSIRERLERIEGEMKVESEPGSGCRITITAPLKS